MPIKFGELKDNRIGRAIEKLIRNRFFLVFGFFSLSLRLLIPPNIVLNSGFDDLLAVQLARNLLDLEWLGVWSNRTFVKPLGYAFYLAMCNTLHLNPVYFLQLMVIMIGFFVSRKLVKCSNLKLEHHAFATKFIFVVLIFNPVYYGQDFNRVYRTSLNVWAVLAFFTFTLYFVESYWTQVKLGNSASLVSRRKNIKQLNKFNISNLYRY
jgi:hypothetical protein